ncbi:hypothetical protein [Nocardioides mesophilus]|uniref:Uncharacterized protein n=1 Tax=Nocardioides mesophilus TaxID=433659 RepID=A0A7G9RD61_9ACTN|nr:hypothetical protein [Nocardioides mesophilus]QNN53536.1 hypothetical protein H9L09_03625 [Nocardioides mesophilus]
MHDDSDDRGLLRFVLERLDAEQEAVILNTPLPAERQMDSDFLDRMVGRGALLQRSRGDKDLIAACVESMQRVQGTPRVATPVGAPDEATVLGSEVIKLIASRFAWHRDYQPHWRPGR